MPDPDPNLDIVAKEFGKTEGMPPEPETRDYSWMPPSTGEVLEAHRVFGVGQLLQNSLNRSYAPDATTADKFLNPHIDELFKEGPYKPKPEELLDPAEANAMYAPKGQDWFDKPISATLARETARERVEQANAQAILDRASTTFSWGGQAYAGIASSFKDPIDAALNFMPGFGEEYVAAKLGGGVIARLAGAGVAGAIGAGGASVAASSIKGLVDPEMTLREGFNDLLYSSVSGAVLQGLGIGGARELWKWRISASQGREAMRSAISQEIEGRPPDVSAEIYPPATDLDRHNIDLWLMSQSPKDRPVLTPEQRETAASIYHTGQDANFAINEALKGTEVPQSPNEVAARELALRTGGFARGLSAEDFRASKEALEAALTAKEEPTPKPPTAVGEVISAPYPMLGEIQARPEVAEAIRNPEFNRANDVPFGAGASEGESAVTNIDRHLPENPEVEGKIFDFNTFYQGVNIHEQIEKAGMEELIRRGLSQEQAYVAAHHLLAEVAERDYVENTLGISWKGYQDWWAKQLEAIQKEKPENPPPNLYKKPYPHDQVTMAQKLPAGPVPMPTAVERAAVEGLKAEVTPSVKPLPATYESAVALVKAEQRGSTSYIQRRLNIGYSAAAEYLDRMEKEGVVGPMGKGGKREVLQRPEEVTPAVPKEEAPARPAIEQVSTDPDVQRAYEAFTIAKEQVKAFDQAAACLISWGV